MYQPCLTFVFAVPPCCGCADVRPVSAHPVKPALLLACEDGQRRRRSQRGQVSMHSSIKLCDHYFNTKIKEFMINNADYNYFCSLKNS